MPHTFHPARSRIGVNNKPSVLELSDALRNRLFPKGPLLGYPFLTRLMHEKKEAHYMHEEMDKLILELRRIAIDLEKDPELSSFRKKLQDIAGTSKESGTNIYAVPVPEKAVGGPLPPPRR